MDCGVPWVEAKMSGGGEGRRKSSGVERTRFVKKCVSIGQVKTRRRLGIIGQGAITVNAHNPYVHACIYYRLGQGRLGDSTES